MRESAVLLVGLVATFVVFFAGVAAGAWDTGDRPSMRIHTDKDTGCQYLSVRNVGLTPRMGGDGKQICEVAR